MENIFLKFSWDQFRGGDRPNKNKFIYLPIAETTIDVEHMWFLQLHLSCNPNLIKCFTGRFKTSYEIWGWEIISPDIWKIITALSLLHAGKNKIKDVYFLPSEKQNCLIQFKENIIITPIDIVFKQGDIEISLSDFSLNENFEDKIFGFNFAGEYNRLLGENFPNNNRIK
jgi:hypothetical protein